MIYLQLPLFRNEIITSIKENCDVSISVDKMNISIFDYAKSDAEMLRIIKGLINQKPYGPILYYNIEIRGD